MVRFTSIFPAVAIVIACAAGGGCSSAPASGTTSTADASAFSGAPIASFATDAGKLHVDLRSAPDTPPSRGVESLELTVTTAAGGPADGLTIAVVPWMPAMGHGASVQPAVTAKGGGKYVVDDVDFFMPGQWQLRMTFSGAVEDHATPVLQIP
jgi:hypothetical protein